MSTSSGEALRDAAIERAADAAGDDFNRAATFVVWNYACTHFTFTSDELWPLLPNVKERRALASTIVRAVKKKVIEPTGTYVPSKRPEAHRGPTMLYRSLIYGAALKDPNSCRRP